MSKKYLTLLLVPGEIGLQLFFKSRGVGLANSGISFGLIKGFPVILILGLLILFIFSAKEIRKLSGWWLILAGGLGNLFSRLVLGGFVWDYLHLWPSRLWLNGADALIFCGVITIMFNLLYGQS